MQKFNNITAFIRRQPLWRQLLVVGILFVAALFWYSKGGRAQGRPATFTARRGDLDITVLEGGSLQALESQEIKCEVRVGYQGTKILKIVEEGYFVTEEDVKNGKVLCELDSSELQKQIVQQEIQFQTASASLTDAQQNYEIQIGQNQSDIKAAEQKVRFARMDFDKYLGDSVTEQIVQELGLDKLYAAATTNNVEETLHAEEIAADKALPNLNEGQTAAMPMTTTLVDGQIINLQLVNSSQVPISQTQSNPIYVNPVSEPEPVETPRPATVDFSKYADIDVLGDGEAKQKLRKLHDDLQVAQKESEQTTVKLEGTRRLFDKGFVTKTDLQGDEIAAQNSRLKVQTAETARDLFLKYEFPKSAEEAMSKYTEAVRELDKARRVAISKLAQARARLNSARGQFQVQLRQRNDLQDQLSKCVLRAEKSGLVVYGSGRDNAIIYSNQDPIGEGATVRERQAIITIPDLSRMAVDVRIHESYIKKIKKGQKARVTVDAFPGQPLTGEVSKVAVLPDSQNRYMNPDLKVYLTTVAISGTHEWVKPGMSAKVEILVDHLDDVVYVPVQSVALDAGKQFCYVMNGFSPTRREVQVGQFNDDFIEIKDGLREGDLVLLHPPETPAPGTAPEDFKQPQNEQETAPPVEVSAKADKA